MKNKSVFKNIMIGLGTICALFLILIIIIFVIIKINFSGEKTEFDSVDDFIAEGGVVYGDVPEGAEDYRYFYSKEPFGHRSMVSFVVNDTDEYDNLMEYYKDAALRTSETFYSDGKWTGYHPYWNTFIENPAYKVTYTEDELEEMTYLEQNYTNMDYKEILSLSRHKYGFLNGYGAKVSDFSTTNYYHEFPVNEWYDNVVDGSLDDYTVICYDYFDGTYHAALVDEESRQFVMISVVTF